MSSATPPTPQLPERFGEVEPLGHGGQVRTVAAFDREHDRRVVIKVLDVSDAADWKVFDRFERECTVLRSLDHPGVPTYREHLRDDDAGRCLLVMDRVEGESLATDLAQGRRRTEAQLLALLEGLLEVLEYLHGLHPPVIHRDIKPSNVIVQPDGKPVLVDFGGVAKVFAPGGATTVVGTFGYMAPEQLHGRVTPGIDLYALGATLAAMAAGEEAELLPRRGLDIDLSEAIAAGPLRRVLESMLYANPEQRPGSVDDVRAALRRARAGNLVRARPPESGLGSAALAPMTGPRVVAQRPRGGSRAPSMLSNVWGHMKPRHRGLAIAYLWIAVGLGVMTKALILSAFLLLLFPVLLGITHALRSDE